VKLPPEKIVVRRAMERARDAAVATVMKALPSDHRANALVVMDAVAVLSQVQHASRVRIDRPTKPPSQLWKPKPKICRRSWRDSHLIAASANRLAPKAEPAMSMKIALRPIWTEASDVHDATEHR
jgi:hypothetical protein